MADSTLTQSETTLADKNPETSNSETKAVTPFLSKDRIISLIKAIFINDKEVEPIAKPARKRTPLERTNTAGKLSDARKNPLRLGNDSASNFQTTIIDKNTVIEGKIITEGSVEVAGKIAGDIIAKGDVLITGTITGDVVGESVTLQHCSVQGSINAEAFIHIDSESVVMGNITSQDLTVDGKVKGNLVIDQSAVLQKNSLIIGNLTAFALSIEMGSVLYGEVKIQQNAVQAIPEEAEAVFQNATSRVAS